MFHYINKEFCNFLTDKKVYIYGAWERGRFLQGELLKYGIDIEGYIDADKKKERYGVPEKKVDRPIILQEKTCFVIVSLAEHNSVYQLLGQYGYMEYKDYIYPAKDIQLSNIKHNYLDYYGNRIEGNIDKAHVTIGGASELIIGKNVKMAEGVEINLGWNSKIIIMDNVSIDKNVSISVLENSYIEIGKMTQISSGGHLRATGRSFISFGDKCRLGMSLVIRLDHNAKFVCGEDCLFSYDIKIRANQGHSIFDLENNKVIEDPNFSKIGNHVWIGMGVSILPGADIGDHCIIGAESMVNKKFDSYQTIAGIPAKVIREKTDWTYEVQSFEEYINSVKELSEH